MRTRSMRNAADDFFSEFNFNLSWRTKTQCLLCLLRHRFDGGCEIVAENHRAPRADVIDVPVAVDIAQICALSSRKKDGVAAYTFEGSHGRIDPARDAELCALHESG